MDNQPEKRDVFSGDTKFNEPKPEPKQEESIKEGAKQLGKGTLHILKGLRHIFLKRVPTNVLVLLIIVLAVFFATNYLKKPTITANVIFSPNATGAISQDEFTALLEENCKTTDWADLAVACPIYPECPVCKNITVTENVTKIVYRYRCPNGVIVDDLDECKELIPEVESPYQKTSNGVTLSIDGLRLTFNDDNKTGHIRQINYTIVNQGDDQISPKIEIKTYKQWNYDVRAAAPKKTLKPENIKTTLDVNEWIVKSSPMIIYFNGEEKTIRLELFDALNDESLVTVTMPLDFDDYR